MTHPSKEQIDAVIEYKGYLVFRCGKIIGKNGKALNPWTNNGYQLVSIWEKGKRRQLFVHNIVADCFLGAKPDGFQTCHVNGIKTDNRAENLRYDTKESNERDKFLHGTALIGERHFASKLTNIQRREIKDRYKSRCPINGAKQLAAKYSVHPCTIAKVARSEDKLLEKAGAA